LDERGQDAATHLQLYRSGKVRIAPDFSARETAEWMRVDDGQVDPGLRAIDLGRWTGLRPDQVAVDELGLWFADPTAVPHGGESVAEFVARLADWLRGCESEDTTAVVAGGTAQGMVAAAIGADFFGLEVAPASVIQLRRRGGRWRLRLADQNW
jgi:broad specificity phosphatase PhoE